MLYQLIAHGQASDLSNLEQYQSHFEEGSEGYLELELSSSVAADIIGWLDEKLDAVGVPGKKVEVNGNLVTIHFRTEIAPLILIAGAIAACILLVGLVLAWKLFKLAPAAAIGISIIAIIAIIAATIAVIALLIPLSRKLGVRR